MYDQNLQNRQQTANRRILPTGVKVGNATPAADEIREYYLTILRNLSRAGESFLRPARTVAITSCFSGEGVTSVAANLAITAASITDGKVLLVDANLARPIVGRSFGVRATPGLAETVLGEVPLQSAIQDSVIDNLSVLTAGKIDGDPSQIYDAASDLSDLIATAASRFDLVVFDTPAAAQTCPALGLYRLLDAVVLVLEAKRASWQVALRTKTRLTEAGVHLAGVVMNKGRDDLPNWLDDSV